MMKRLSLLLLLLAAAGGALRAQGPHELHLSVSGPAGGGIYDDSGSLFNWGSDLYSIYEPGERVDSGPVYSLGYTYALRSWLRVGAEASIGMLWVDKGQARAWGDQVEATWQRLYTVMPLVHLVALNAPHFKIYGKIAAGGQLSIGDYEGLKIRPAVEVVPLGLQWGGERIFGLAEFGIGNVYVGRLGIGLRW